MPQPLYKTPNLWYTKGRSIVEVGSRLPKTKPKSRPAFTLISTPPKSLDQIKVPEKVNIEGILCCGAIIPPIPSFASIFKRGVGYITL